MRQSRSIRPGPRRRARRTWLRTISSFSYFSYFSFHELGAESQMIIKRCLVRVAFAFGVFAPTIDIWRLFHCLALGAAILVCGCLTRTNWVCALIGFRGVHFFLPCCDRERMILGKDTNHWEN